MNNMSKFQLALTGIFAISILVGVALFAMSKGTSSTQAANLVVWGTLPNQIFDAAYKNSSLKENSQIKISYVKKDEATFDADLLEALANGAGPDIVILREDGVYKNRNKIFVIPHDNYSERAFKDNFIEEGELFLTSEGVLALPFMVDPLVMYWNRDLFTNNLISKPPQYWDEMYSLINTITKRSSGGDITLSAIALGGWANITNAKEIIGMLLLQGGTPITARNSQGVTSVLNSQFNYPVAPSDSAVNFYTQFSNPSSPAYTWNRGLPTSLNLFLSGNLATYIGFASEIASIQQKNSNLNFDVTYVPQIRDASKRIVFGHMQALSIVKQSKQISAAFVAVNGLSETNSLKAVETVTNLPPVRRDLLAVKPTDAFRTVFYNSALLARSWIDPDRTKSSAIFRDMIESIISGRKRQSEALSQANDELNLALSK